jgi:hypothetical protein
MSEALDRLRRWEDSGAVWRIVADTGDAMEIALLTCDAGEEMDRIRSTDEDLVCHVRAHPGDD